MKRENQIGWIAICGTFLLYPILPQYIYIFKGLNIVNFCGALTIVSAIIGGVIYKCKIPYLIFPYILYATYYFIETAIDLLIDGGFVLSLLGIVESITKINLFQLFSNANGLTFFHEVRYGFLRIMGTFGQPISYGLYQVFIIALIIYRLKNYTQYSQKHTFLKVAYLLSVINILLTVSRIPIIACILLHILLLYKKSKKEFINYAVAISILLLLLIIFNDTVGMKIPLISDYLQLEQ